MLSRGTNMNIKHEVCPTCGVNCIRHSHKEESAKTPWWENDDRYNEKTTLHGGFLYEPNIPAIISEAIARDRAVLREKIRTAQLNLMKKLGGAQADGLAGESRRDEDMIDLGQLIGSDDFASFVLDLLDSSNTK